MDVILFSTILISDNEPADRATGGYRVHLIVFAILAQTGKVEKILRAVGAKLLTSMQE
jgi:hypothetical protein